MSLINVEKIEQDNHEKTWFQKFRSKASTKFAVASSALIVGSANAAEGDLVIPDYITPVKSAFTGLATDLGAFFLVCLGVTIAIVIFTVSRGGIKKGGSS
jgi:hypothetical protein